LESSSIRASTISPSSNDEDNVIKEKPRIVYLEGFQDEEIDEYLVLRELILGAGIF